MFILIVFDDAQIEKRLADAFRQLGEGLSFSSTPVAAILRDPRLDRVPDAVIVDVGDAPAPRLDVFRDDLVRKKVPVFVLMTPALLRRARRDEDERAGVFLLDRERALADPVGLASSVVAYAGLYSGSDGSGTALSEA